MFSSFACGKKELEPLFVKNSFQTRKIISIKLKKVIEEYIKYYNEKRINVKRKGLSPLAYRQQSLS